MPPWFSIRLPASLVCFAAAPLLANPNENFTVEWERSFEAGTSFYAVVESQSREGGCLLLGRRAVGLGESLRLLARTDRRGNHLWEATFSLRGSCAQTGGAADADDSGQVDLSDAIGLLGCLFRLGEPPASPGPAVCGGDATADALDCGVFPPCA